jgi:hypothetical protein
MPSERGREILTDPGAESADPDVPAFIARPAGAPVYHGFPIIEGTRTPDGWCFGAITSFEEPEECDSGDAFVIAPDGSRAGIVWEVGDGDVSEICAPDPARWGVYAVWFREPVHDVDDFTRELHALLPALRAIHAGIAARPPDTP